MSATSDLIQKIYIGYFGRAGDPAGLQYWVEQSAAGLSDAAIAQSFSVQPEATAMYGFLAAPSLDMGREEFLNSVYQNLFGRDIDAEGEDYWLGQLDAGRPVGGIILDIINGAQNTSLGQDLTVVTNKLAVANYYTEKVITENATWTLADDQADAIAVLADVTSATASITSGQALADTLVAADTVPQGSSFTLTTDVAGVTGTSGNDTFTGVLGSSATYQIGDAVFGGAGTDTLNILDASGTAAGVVQLSSIETVNVRTLVASGTDVTEINAADWSGVATLSNASSIAASELQFSGLAVATQVVLHGNTDISGNFANTTTADVSIGAINAGSFAGVTTFGTTAVTADATAHFTIDGAAAGTISGVSISLSGNNLVSVDAGATADSFTITGSGSAVLFTTAQLATVNASAYAGTLDLTLNGASDVTVTGGGGNDTLRLGTTFSNSDSFNGGSGTDTIRASIAGFNRTLNTTNVENAVLTFLDAAGGDVNASASTVTSFTFAAGTAGNAASVSQMANASTVTLNDDDLGDVTLDYASGAATTTINIGSPSGAVAIGTLAITDVAAVTINAVGVSGTVGGTITTASFDSDLKSLAITTSGGEADLTIGDTNTDMSLGGATSLTVTSNGSAGITFNNVDLAGTALASVSVNANNSNAADIVLGDISGQSITSVSLSAASGADILMGTLDLGAEGSAATAGSITLTVTQGANSDVIGSHITVSGQEDLTINITNGSTAIAAFGTITLSDTGTSDAAADLTFGAVSVGTGSEVAIIGINMVSAGTGAQITFGAITVGQDGGYSAGAITMATAGGAMDARLNVDVSSRTVTVGASATATFGNIVENSGGAVGAVTLTLLSDATATFGTVTASAISTHTIVANTGASANFGAMTAEQAVGAINIGGVDGADVQFGTIGGSAVGAILVSGAANVTFGTITTNRIGEVNNQQQGVSGQFTIDLSGVSAAAEVKLGLAQNTVISGLGNDVITLTGGGTATAGNDVIRFTTSTQNTDNIINFIAGNAASGGDQIEIYDDILEASGLYFAGGTAVVAASDVSLSFASGAAITWTADTNVFVYGTAVSNTADLVSSIQSEVTLAAALGDGASANYLVVWTDGSDTYVSTLEVEGGSTGANTTLTLASASAADITTTLAVLQGVTPGALVAANFDFV